MRLFKNFVSQTRKPEEILEVGCGGGRNAHELLRNYPSSKVTAIDYSDVSVAKAAAYNQSLQRNKE